MLGSSGELVGPHVRNLFRVLLDQQEQKGLAEYGQPLNLDSKIDPLEYGLRELVDAFQYIALGMLRRDSGGEGGAWVQEGMIEMSRKADAIINNAYLELRNGRGDYERGEYGGVVMTLRTLGFLDDAAAELWLRRAQTCPGHDDEGGRSWCSYCGDMPTTGAPNE